MEINYINQASDILYNSRIQLKKIKELPSEYGGSILDSKFINKKIFISK